MHLFFFFLWPLHHSPPLAVVPCRTEIINTNHLFFSLRTLTSTTTTTSYNSAHCWMSSVIEHDAHNVSNSIRVDLALDRTHNHSECDSDPQMIFGSGNTSLSSTVRSILYFFAWTMRKQPIHLYSLLLLAAAIDNNNHNPFHRSTFILSRFILSLRCLIHAGQRATTNVPNR